MSLLQKLKSVFGLGDDDGGKSRRDVGVTVEHEPSEPDEPEPATETESAVKGADVDSSAAETDAPAVDESEAATEESETAVDESDAAEESEAAAEEAIEEAEPDAEGEEEPAETEPDAEGEEEPAETEADAEAEAEPEEPEPEAPEGTLEDVKGIGPAYAERLRNAGVDSIADLADADAEDLAAETDLSATRIENWIEQAKVR
jgi:predicted flap endonuclease-1-like 5' DNA nuclease